jgi:hypothetical protein
VAVSSFVATPPDLPPASSEGARLQTVPVFESTSAKKRKTAAPLPSTIVSVAALTRSLLRKQAESMALQETENKEDMAPTPMFEYDRKPRPARQPSAPKKPQSEHKPQRPNYRAASCLGRLFAFCESLASRDGKTWHHFWPPEACDHDSTARYLGAEVVNGDGDLRACASDEEVLGRLLGQSVDLRTAMQSAQAAIASDRLRDAIPTQCLEWSILEHVSTDNTVLRNAFLLMCSHYLLSEKITRRPGTTKVIRDQVSRYYSEAVVEYASASRFAM